MESDLILYSVNAIRSMEVVDISTGSKLGYIRDFKVDLETNKIVSIFYVLKQLSLYAMMVERMQN